MKKIKNIFGLLVLTVLVSACDDRVFEVDGGDNPGQYSLITLGGATKDAEVLRVFPYVESRTLSTGVMFGGIVESEKDIQVKTGFDQKAFDSINAIRALNGAQPYQMFPSGSYEFSTMDFVIPKGKTNSNYGTFTYHPNEFDPDIDYLLPISIKSTSAYKVNPTGKTVYYYVNHLQEVPADTGKWTLEFSSEEATGEGPDNGHAADAIDGDISTFWHTQWSGGNYQYPHYIAFLFNEDVYVTQLGIIKRQAKENGFTKFNILITKDGTTWETYKTDVAFDQTNDSEQIFKLDEPMTLKGVKLVLTEGLSRFAYIAEFNAYTYQ